MESRLELVKRDQNNEVEAEMSDDNILVPEVVGKTITQMRVYAEGPDCFEVGLWFTDGTELTVEIETRTQINLKHVGLPDQEPNNITAQMNVLNAREGD